MQDQEAVIAATNTYFASRAAGDFETAYDFVSEALSAQLPRSLAEERWAEEREQGVDFLAMQITNGTWYTNPEGLPPGIYAAVDFAGQSEALPITCGYLVWHLAEDGPQLNRAEINLVAAEDFAQIPSDQRQSIAAQMGC